jgi:hypothetical protein
MSHKSSLLAERIRAGGSEIYWSARRFQYKLSILPERGREQEE